MRTVPEFKGGIGTEFPKTESRRGNRTFEKWLVWGNGFEKSTFWKVICGLSPLDGDMGNSPCPVGVPYVKISKAVFPESVALMEC